MARIAISVEQSAADPGNFEIARFLRGPTAQPAQLAESACPARRRLRCEIQKSAAQPTANSAERTLTAVMAVPHPGLWEKSAASIGSNGSTSSEDFSEIEATIHRLCDARNDDDGNGVARLSDLREYLPERWPCLIGPFNVEAAKYETTSGADDDDWRPPSARR